MKAPNPPAPDQSRYNVRSRKRDRGKTTRLTGVYRQGWGEEGRIREKTGTTWLANNAKQEIREQGAQQEPEPKPLKYNAIIVGRACPGREHPVPATPACSPTYLPCRRSRGMMLVRFCVGNGEDIFTRLASTAPPRKTMCLRRGGSSMRTLNF